MSNKPSDGFYKLYDCVNGEYVGEYLYDAEEAVRYLKAHRYEPAIKNGDWQMIGNDDTDIIDISDVRKAMRKENAKLL